MTTAADREARREIVKFLGRLETAWTKGRFEELRECFLEAAVLVSPDLEQRMEGRDPIIASYAEFLAESRLLKFDSEPPMIEVFGDTAVSLTGWTVEYERQGEVQRESGKDLLVLARKEGAWKIAWRTLILAACAAFVCLAAACGGSGSDSQSQPAPQPLGEATDLPGAGAPPPEQQARELAGNPRLLLFDVQTALEGVRETHGAYPSEDEFRATESWALQRAALDAAFDTWTFESDGQTYRLTGESGGRAFSISSAE
ncbi:MAG TPA: DUF4440 domain-containing protein [Gemmatimonadota bacterium]|jgi:ketosteroid isomerase-like protein